MKSWSEFERKGIKSAPRPLVPGLDPIMRGLSREAVVIGQTGNMVIRPGIALVRGVCICRLDGKTPYVRTSFFVKTLNITNVLHTQAVPGSHGAIPGELRGAPHPPPGPPECVRITQGDFSANILAIFFKKSPKTRK